MSPGAISVTMHGPKGETRRDRFVGNAFSPLGILRGKWNDRHCMACNYADDAVAAALRSPAWPLASRLTLCSAESCSPACAPTPRQAELGRVALAGLDAAVATGANRVRVTLVGVAAGRILWSPDRFGRASMIVVQRGCRKPNR